MNILDEIVLNTRKEVEYRCEQRTIGALENEPLFDRTPLSLVDFIRDPSKSGIISEVKKKSPSKGVINDLIEVDEVAEGYETAGASAISILTDFKYFGGKMEYLTAARAKVNVPILRKDFMIDEYQVYEAKAIGADVILLIAACLTPAYLEHLAKLAKDLGLSVLLEVHDAHELNETLNSYVDAVGVNNRNLKTFEVAIQTSLELAPLIPDQYLKVSESGLKDGATIRQLKSAGYEGFLIGETFMKQANPAKALHSFIEDIKNDG